MRPAALVLLAALASMPAHAHDWYGTLKRGDGYSCCNDEDCRIAQARPRDDGTWEVFFAGKWHAVPPDRILPDRMNQQPLHSHVCEQDGYIRCFLRGGGGT